MQRDATQKSLGLAFGVHRAPKDAPRKMLGLIETDAQAVAVSIAFAGAKHEYIGQCLGRSRSMVTLYANGERRLPDNLVRAFCAATGTNLLAQYRELQSLMEEVDETKRLAEMLRRAVA